MELNDEFHNAILAEAPDRFPVESFSMLRRNGSDVAEALEMLGYRETDLSFQMRAVLSVDVDDTQALRALLG